MGTERTVYHRQLCRCGQGEFIVELLEPDHPYARPSQRQWEPFIQCNVCKQDFALIEQSGEILLVYNSELEKREGYTDQYLRQSSTFMHTRQVKDYLRQLEQVISTQRSIAAVYRLLTANQLLDKSESAFRREYENGPSKWIEWNIEAEDLPKVLQLLGKKDDELLEKVSQLHELGEKGSRNLTQVGPIICKIKR